MMFAYMSGMHLLISQFIGFIHGVTKNTNVKVASNLLSVMWSKLITSS